MADDDRHVNRHPTLLDQVGRGRTDRQSERRQGVSCTSVTTERTRTWIEDGRTEVDTVTARYRPEGLRCDGSPSDPADRATTTTSTVPPSTTVP